MLLPSLCFCLLGSKVFAISEPELPADPLCDLVRSWREVGVYQKALIDGNPALEGTLVTSLDRDAIIDQIKSTCSAYHLTYRTESENAGLPFIIVRVMDGDLARTFMIFPQTDAGGTMVKFSFREASDPSLVSILDVLPELSEIGGKIEFRKENFADGAHSALFIYRDQSPPSFALDDAVSVLRGAGWQRSAAGQSSVANSTVMFTKDKFSLLLRAREGRDGGAILNCTVCENVNERAPIQPPVRSR
jgi:hypothetical protein